MPVDDAAGHRLQEVRVRDRVEVFRQIGVHHVGVTLADQPVYFLDGPNPAATGPVALSAILEVCLEDRFQHQFGGGLSHPVPERRDAKRAFAAPRLRDHHPPYRRRPIGLLGKVLPQVCQPLRAAQLLDLREGHPVHARRSPVGTGQRVGVFQDVFPAYLVVEQVEAVVRLCLSLAIELSLKDPDLILFCESHLQSPDPLRRQKRTRSQGPSLHRSYQASAVLCPCPTPAAAAARCRRSRTLPSPRRVSPDYPDRLPDVPCPLSRRIGRVLVSILPRPCSLPRFPGGSASATSLSRPAQASLTLRPA